ncbi:MAG: DUF86 domain-containing protein, partial [bacterium]
RRDQDYLGDIREAIQRIAAYTVGLTYEQFMKDNKTQDAVIRNLEVIGEATKNLSSHLRKTYPQIPWKDLAGMRDKMIHHYFGINYEIVWTIAKGELPGLLPKIEDILTKEMG